MQQPARLVFFHQNCLFRQLLVQAFSNLAGFEATELNHARPDRCDHLRAIEPAVVLLDLSLPHKLAVELTSFAREHLPETKAIVLVQGAKLSEHTEAALLDCIEAGAHGFVLEESSLQDLRNAIDAVMAGQRFYSQMIVETMFDQLAKFSRESRWRSRLTVSTLTKRELEVLRWIAEGLSNKQVARKLCVSLYTVKNHVHNILEKLQVADRSKAVEHAIGNRWFVTGIGGDGGGDGQSESVGSCLLAGVHRMPYSHPRTPRRS